MSKLPKTSDIDLPVRNYASVHQTRDRDPKVHFTHLFFLDPLCGKKGKEIIVTESHDKVTCGNCRSVLKRREKIV